MDSTTLLGLVGIAGTLLGAAIGARGATSAARVTSRGHACRKVLHPAAVERFPWRQRRRWWLRNG